MSGAAPEPDRYAFKSELDALCEAVAQHVGELVVDKSNAARDAAIRASAAGRLDLSSAEARAIAEVAALRATIRDMEG
jgi:phytoene/squalene synthetase